MDVFNRLPALTKDRYLSDQALSLREDALLVLVKNFHVVDRVACLDVQGDGFASQGLHEDLHSTPEPENEVQSALLLNVVPGGTSPDNSRVFGKVFGTINDSHGPRPAGQV